tara:strand:+ start:3184 stop:3558 length:375 start_codon:yes stop_codon:yes gene_type:complete
MNYLLAVKKYVKVNVDESKVLNSNVKTIMLSDEENYFENVKDSIKVDVLNDLEDLCRSFLYNSEFYSPVLLMDAHCGKRSFICEMLSLMDSQFEVKIEVIEDADVETDNDSDYNEQIDLDRDKL